MVFNHLTLSARTASSSAADRIQTQLWRKQDAGQAQRGPVPSVMNFSMSQSALGTERRGLLANTENSWKRIKIRESCSFSLSLSLSFSGFDFFKVPLCLSFWCNATWKCIFLSISCWFLFLSSLEKKANKQVFFPHVYSCESDYSEWDFKQQQVFLLPYQERKDVFSACEWICGKILGRQRQISAELKQQLHSCLILYTLTDFQSRDDCGFYNILTDVWWRNAVPA